MNLACATHFSVDFGLQSRFQNEIFSLDFLVGKIAHDFSETSPSLAIIKLREREGAAIRKNDKRTRQTWLVPIINLHNSENTKISIERVRMGKKRANKKKAQQKQDDKLEEVLNECNQSCMLHIYLRGSLFAYLIGTQDLCARASLIYVECYAHHSRAHDDSLSPNATLNTHFCGLRDRACLSVIHQLAVAVEAA